MAALLRLIPYLVAINSWSLELEFSEANHFGKVNKAVCFAVIKLFASLFKMSKCKMVMGFGYVAQNKSTCPSSAACSLQNPLVLPGPSLVEKFQSQVTNEQSQNVVLVNYY